ncbi:MAG: ThuA domain-containing protein [Anaerolineales bacterium]|nr:ThuA domain-containing protein [Anaerolineales bacterium]
MKALALCGDKWHPEDVARRGLAALRDPDFTLAWRTDARAWPEARLDDFALVILAKSNNASSSDPAPWMTDAVQAAFAEFVRRGGGLLAVHSGAAEYENARVLRGLLGGVFSRHPDPCPVTLIPREGHPLAAGVDSFTAVDEHYFMEMDDPEADVFAITRSEHGEQPGAWRRTEGQGRVAVLTPGHSLEVWLHPSYQTLIGNAARWCAKLT